MHAGPRCAKMRAEGTPHARDRIDPQVDYAFKRLFGHEERMGLCADLVNAVIGRPPGTLFHDLALMNTHNVPRFEGQKESIYDIRVRDFSQAQFHLEMQRVPPWSFQSRVVYYCTFWGKPTVTGPCRAGTR